MEGGDTGVKRLLVAALAVVMLGCASPEPEPDWEAFDKELDRIESLLENCLEGEREFRHHICYERSIRRIDDLADEYGIELDK